MKDKILLINFSDNFLIEAAKKLNTTNNVYFYGDTKNENDLKIFNNYLNPRDLNFDNLKSEKNILKNKIIDDYSEIESFFFLFCDRVLIKALSFRKKKEYYLNFLNFWLNFFEKNDDFGLIIFESHPHMPQDIFPYFVSKKLGIDCYIIKSTSVQNSILFDKNLTSEPNYYEFNKLSSSENFINNFYKTNNKQKFAKKINATKHFDVFNNFFYYLFSRLRIIRNFKILYNRHKNSYHNGSFLIYLFLVIYREVEKTYFRFFLKRQSNPDLKKNYFYFSLHYQPERSTDPQSSNYTFQLLALKILDRIVPPNYLIYVKEHPRQYSDNFPDLRKIHFRDKKFYLDIEKLNNVKLINMNSDSDELIKNSKLNISCTGSNVWLGIKDYLIPGIHFGSTWLNLCHSTPSALNLDEIEIKNLIQKLLSKEKHEIKEDLENFKNLISKYSINSYNGELYSDDNKDMLINNLVDAIKTIYERK